MFRPLILASALLASPVFASSAYHADPAARPAESRFVLRDIIWRCTAAGCAADRASNSRPAIVCAALAREIGALRSFSVNGAAFGPEALQKCNEAAD